MAIPLFDLSRQGARVDAAVSEAVRRVLAHQQFILGLEVSAFEEEVTEFLGGGVHSIGVSSGTDALLALLMASDLGSGDAVITTPYTFFATAGCIHRVGAEIIFSDIEPRAYMMDPKKLRSLLESFSRQGDGTLLTPKGNRVRAIMPIHLFGTCCDMDAMNEIAREYGLSVIEDAAQVLGADHPTHDGAMKGGTVAEMSYFSFYPSKNLGAAGDAGLVVCRSAALAEKIRSVRNHGMAERYYHKVVGGNFRLDALQAAILRAKLPFLSEWNAARRANAAAYQAAFTKAGLLDRISLPFEPWGGSGLTNHHIYHQYVIRLSGSKDTDRDTVAAHLSRQGIGHAIYYPVPLHLQECFAYLGHKAGDFPESECAAQESLALPIFPGLRPDEIETVVASLAEALS